MNIDRESIISDLKVYPNPTDNELNIRLNLEKSQGLTFSLMNVQGQEVLNKFIAGQNGQNLVVLGTESIAKGIYFLNILTANSTKSTRKIVIK